MPGGTSLSTSNASSGGNWSRYLRSQRYAADVRIWSSNLSRWGSHPAELKPGKPLQGELLARRVLQETNRQNNFQVVIYGRLTDTNHAGGAGAQHQHDETGTEHQKIYVQTMEEAN